MYHVHLLDPVDVVPLGCSTTQKMATLRSTHNYQSTNHNIGNCKIVAMSFGDDNSDALG